MRHAPPLALVAALALAACTGTVSEKKDPLAPNVIDQAGLGDLMLTAGDPEEAVAYFRRSLAESPERADFRRGLAISLSRAGQLTEAARVYQEMEELGQARPGDRLAHAMVALRLDRWERARALEADLPASLRTPRRLVLQAMLADHAEDWAAADAAYREAVGLSSNPASIYNNWGVSHQARGNLSEAEAKFERALGYDSTLFNAKNNLAITRALQGNYELPVVPVTETEKAKLLNNLGIIAMRRGDTGIAKGLFAGAVNAHPQYYQGAADRLASLENKAVQ